MVLWFPSFCPWSVDPCSLIMAVETYKGTCSLYCIQQEEYTGTRNNLPSHAFSDLLHPWGHHILKISEPPEIGSSHWRTSVQIWAYAKPSYVSFTDQELYITILGTFSSGITYLMSKMWRSARPGILISLSLKCVITVVWLKQHPVVSETQLPLGLIEPWCAHGMPFVLYILCISDSIDWQLVSLLTAVLRSMLFTLEEQ